MSRFVTWKGHWKSRQNKQVGVCRLIDVSPDQEYPTPGEASGLHGGCVVRSTRSGGEQYADLGNIGLITEIGGNEEDYVL